MAVPLAAAASAARAEALPALAAAAAVVAAAATFREAACLADMSLASSAANHGMHIHRVN
jgi:hypothetical protein